MYKTGLREPNTLPLGREASAPMPLASRSRAPRWWRGVQRGSAPALRQASSHTPPTSAVPATPTPPPRAPNRLADAPPGPSSLGDEGSCGVGCVCVCVCVCVCARARFLAHNVLLHRDGALRCPLPRAPVWHPGPSNAGPRGRAPILPPVLLLPFPICVSLQDRHPESAHQLPLKDRIVLRELSARSSEGQ